MRILVAGATGAVGARLVPMLVERGHEVSGTTRSADRADRIRGQRAEPLVLDALDREQVRAAVARAKPDVVIHQLTAIGKPDLRRFDDWFAQTNRLRVEGTDNLIAAARAAGTRRIVAQSYAGWPSGRTGPPVTTEAEPLDDHPARNATRTLAAIRHLERAVAAADPLEGVVLRYGGLYGPGNAIGAGGDMLAMVRKRQLPVVGDGGGVWSFLHIDDAAAAAVLAAEGGPQGTYNVVDDEPAAVRVWLPFLARCVGAKPPLHVPAWLVRPVLGEQAMFMMTQFRGASNAKARAELGFVPRYPSWREGFRDGLG